MSGMEADTIGGFNAMIEKQKAIEGKVYVTTVLFSNDSEVIHDRLPIDQISPMTDKDYSVGGCTALLDAIGDTLSNIEKIHKYAREEDVPEHTVFVITTDGMENASREYSSDKIKKMIKEKEKLGWEFLFIAANIDSVEAAQSIGIRKERAATYKQTKKGTRASFECMDMAITALRECRSIDEETEWRKTLDKS